MSDQSNEAPEPNHPILLVSRHGDPAELAKLASQMEGVEPGEILTFSGDLQIFHRIFGMWMRAEDTPVGVPQGGEGE